MEFCIHRASGNAINPKAPEREKTYKCAKCGKIIKPIYGLGEKGLAVILMTMMLLFLRIPWIKSLMFSSREVRWGWRILAWIVFCIIDFILAHIIFKYCAPVYKVVRL